ncbi:DUF3592 domain-containing protein [Massilia suwonensis]|uniref:DUF3592 domain-containing protein n=1 Tax=Massilia suwonensis TaxID=648895 RepID=A0ABW0MJI3_9BURK
MNPITLVVSAVLLLCYAIGILLVKLGLRDIRLGLGARTWPTAPARLERCVIGRPPLSTSPVSQVLVKYSYTVAGVRYSGDNLAIGYLASNNRRVHEETRQRVLDMPSFRIRYHPDQPDISTIFPAENSLVFGTFVFALLWLAFTTVFTLIVLAISGVGRTMLDWFGL